MSVCPLQKYVRYVKHVSFNTCLLNLLQSPNFNVKNMCVMQNTSPQCGGIIKFLLIKTEQLHEFDVMIYLSWII